LLNHSYEPKNGGFSVSYSKSFNTGLPSQVIPCLTGNMVYSMIKLGYLEDTRVQKSIDWIVNFQRFDDGEYINNLPNEINHLKACFSTHSCFMGVVKCLKALAQIPESKKSVLVKKKIKDLSEFLLKHHLYKKSSDLSKISKPGWTKFGFPLMYQTDVLEILDIFRKLEIYDKRLNEAIDLVKRKQTINGWILENTMNGKTIIDIGEKGKINQWLTDKATKIINYYSSYYKE
jgi:hypothetical protein